MQFKREKLKVTEAMEALQWDSEWHRDGLKGLQSHSALQRQLPNTTF